MTDLTEQMHKGELPEGLYYVNDGIIDYCLGGYWENYSNEEIAEVLAKVPSYDDYMMMKDCAKKEFEAVERYTQVKETNEALKSELKEVCDVLIHKCPEMKEWVMLNWKNLYEVQDE